MADSKITALTENTAPLGTDYAVLVDDPGGTPVTQYTTVTNLMTKAPLVLIAGSFNDNPTDATTYYFGTWPNATMTTAAATRRIYMPRDGTITKVDLYATCSTGSNETSTIYVRKNNTTDTTVSSTVVMNANPYHSLVTGLSASVSAGDYVEMKWVTPTWGTNPTAVYWWVQIFLA